MKSGLKDAVIFTGWQKDMRTTYAAVDMVTITSYNEGTPVSLIEAMAAANPVISTDVGGVRDIMGKPCGKKYLSTRNKKLH